MEPILTVKKLEGLNQDSGVTTDIQITNKGSPTHNEKK